MIKKKKKGTVLGTLRNNVIQLFLKAVSSWSEVGTGLQHFTPESTHFLGSKNLMNSLLTDRSTASLDTINTLCSLLHHYNPWMEICK